MHTHQCLYIYTFVTAIITGMWAQNLELPSMHETASIWLPIDISVPIVVPRLTLYTSTSRIYKYIYSVYIQAVVTA